MQFTHNKHGFISYLSAVFGTLVFTCLFSFSFAEKGEESDDANLVIALSAPTNASDPIDLPVKGWLLMDYNTGAVLEQINGYESLEPASITKLMTAYIITGAIESGKISEDDLVTVSAYARSQEGSRMFVEKDSKIPVRDLMNGMIIQSGNDSTVALSEYLAGSETDFVNIMNETARKLGLNNTHYRNVTGLPAPGHISTAYDIALLSRHIINDYPNHYRLYAQKEFTWNKIKQKNRNRLLWLDPSVDGIKTGHTDSAGYCLVASALRGKFRLIAVVLGAKNETDRYKSTLDLINYGYQHYESRRIYEANQSVFELPVKKGTKSSVQVGFEKPLDLAFRKGQYEKIVAKVRYSNQLSAPIKANQEVAELVLELNGKELTAQKLIALDEVSESGFIFKILDESIFRIKNKLHYLQGKIF